MKKRALTILVLALVSLAFVSTLASNKYNRTKADKKSKSHISGVFKVPRELEKEVNFWKNIYTKYDRNQIVIHDTKNLDIVYTVVDINDISKRDDLTDEQKRCNRNERVDAEMEKIRAVLLDLDKKPDDPVLKKNNENIVMLFKDINEDNKYRIAASSERLRSQTGQKDKFVNGIITSGRYMSEIESIFEKEKLPKELTRLIFVESMFNTRALSKVGASGIWQFMPGTGRLYLNINRFIDERNDPISATLAAAALLRHNYEQLGSWPLAVNAYNTGYARIAQAVRTLKTKDIEKIIHNFKHSTYGFASRNFYCEFLAALDTYENHTDYFGQLNIEPPLEYDLVPLSGMISLKDLSDMADVDTASVIALNPGLRDEVIMGQLPLPSGYSLRVPAGKGPKFVAALENSLKDPSKVEFASNKDRTTKGKSKAKFTHTKTRPHRK